MMVNTFWYILLLATNLSETSASEFNLSIVKDGRTTHYHIYSCPDKLWVIDWPNKYDSTKTTPLNFIIEKETVLKTLLEKGNLPISLADKIYDPKTVDWRKTKEIKLSSDLEKNGETSINVNRNDKGFMLSQKKGLLDNYSQISVEWVTLK